MIRWKGQGYKPKRSTYLSALLISTADKYVISEVVWNQAFNEQALYSKKKYCITKAVEEITSVLRPELPLRNS